ncbi:MAG TPA: hypothetical protein VHW23_00310 [Kofleriaceae bacterium]|nr:hypothetical protein [Kofleriaceae bacterium]
MMTRHRAAMLMLREAAYYELFQGERLAPCRPHGVGKGVCWVRFHCALRGQLMELRFENLDCRVAAGQPELDDAQLLSCVREQLTISDPIGIPLEAANELGDYVGPLDVTWYVN